MHVEIVLAALVMVVAVLVAADFFRRTSDAPHDYPAGNEQGPGLDAGREGARQESGTRTPAPSPDPGGPRPNWLVRTRLCLLAVVSAAAAALATASFIRAVGAFQRASADSNVSSMRDGAIASAVLALLFAAVILAVGLCSALILIRSVLRPLRQLRTGAVELTEVWLPDALRNISLGHISRTDGKGRPLAVKAVGVSALDEIGDVARAFDQVQGEVLRLADNEAGLRGKLSEMFTELSGRGQTLMEHQLRLIDELGQTELDAGRRASLVTMNHLATRMRRYSQNLLVLAYHELPGRWNRPVMLVDVIRAAVVQTGSTSACRSACSRTSRSPTRRHRRSAPDRRAGRERGVAVGRGYAGRHLRPRARHRRRPGRGHRSGVGMNPETMAQANWRLENPPPVDVAVSRNMGLFVVGRLAARHGVKVRLQPAPPAASPPGLAARCRRRAAGGGGGGRPWPRRAGHHGQLDQARADAGRRPDAPAGHRGPARRPWPARPLGAVRRARPATPPRPACPAAAGPGPASRLASGLQLVRDLRPVAASREQPAR
jgi:hypothetical protein